MRRLIPPSFVEGTHVQSQGRVAIKARSRGWLTYINFPTRILVACRAGLQSAPDPESGALVLNRTF